MKYSRNKISMNIQNKWAQCPRKKKTTQKHILVKLLDLKRFKKKYILGNHKK